jgi:hypothetical protein
MIKANKKVGRKRKGTHVIPAAAHMGKTGRKRSRRKRA